MSTRLSLTLLMAVGVALVLAAAAGAQTPGQDSVNVTGAGQPFDKVAIIARATPAGQNVTGTATVSLTGTVVVSGPVTCLNVTGPDQGGGTPTAPTAATLNFQDPAGVLTVRVVDNGGQIPLHPDEIQVAALGRSPTDCSPLPDGFGIDALLTEGRAIVFDVPLVPTSKDQCKNGGWRNYGVFEYQGDCVSFVATGGRNQAGGP
jgi:hypothetical protein